MQQIRRSTESKFLDNLVKEAGEDWLEKTVVHITSTGKRTKVKVKSLPPKERAHYKPNERGVSNHSKIEDMVNHYHKNRGHDKRLEKPLDEAVKNHGAGEHDDVDQILKKLPSDRLDHYHKNNISQQLSDHLYGTTWSEEKDEAKSSFNKLKKLHEKHPNTLSKNEVKKYNKHLKNINKEHRTDFKL